MASKKNDAGGLRYVGLGFALGVPRRDLTADEVEQYGGRKRILSLICPNTGKPMYAPAESTKPVEGVTEDANT